MVVVVSPNVLVSGVLVSAPSGPGHIAKTMLAKSAFKKPKPPFRREKNTVYSPLLAKILN